MLLLLRIEATKAFGGVDRFACMQIFMIHPSGHIPLHDERGAATLRHRPASGRGGASRVVSGPLSAVRRVPCASRPMCACVRQLNLRDIKRTPLYFICTANHVVVLDSKTLFLVLAKTGFHVACMARPSTGHPLRRTPCFRLCERAAPATGLGRGRELECAPRPSPRRRRDRRPQSENAPPEEKTQAYFVIYRYIVGQSSPRMNESLLIELRGQLNC